MKIGNDRKCKRENETKWQVSILVILSIMLSVSNLLLSNILSYLSQWLSILS